MLLRELAEELFKQDTMADVSTKTQYILLLITSYLTWHGVIISFRLFLLFLHYFVCLFVNCCIKGEEKCIIGVCLCSWLSYFVCKCNTVCLCERISDWMKQRERGRETLIEQHREWVTLIWETEIKGGRENERTGSVGWLTAGVWERATESETYIYSVIYPITVACAASASASSLLIPSSYPAAML